MKRWGWGLAALVLVVSGCGAETEPETSSPSTATKSSAVPSPTPSLAASVAERCGIEARGEMALAPAAGGALSAGAVGEGSTGAVLLHQTSGAGMCGWATYGQWLADKGVNVVMLDLCGYGQSQCDEALSKDWGAQVKAGIGLAKKRGATTVTVVGASLGGVVAMGVGQQAGADAVVNLSGPKEWDGVPDALTAAKATTVPLLVSAAAADDGIDAEALQAAVEASPAKEKRYVPMKGSEHGWGGISDGMSVDPVFTPLATTVLNWVKGSYGG